MWKQYKLRSVRATFGALNPCPVCDLIFEWRTDDYSRTDWQSEDFPATHKILRDLNCIRLSYMFAKDRLNRSIVEDSLQSLARECLALNFADSAERKAFLEQIANILSDIVDIIEAHKDRDKLRKSIQEDAHKRKAKLARPTFKDNVLPWSQFANAESPAIDKMQRVRPNSWPPVQRLPPRYVHLINTSVQTLPPATSAIVANWTEEFKGVLDYLHEVRLSTYPHAELGKCWD